MQHDEKASADECLETAADAATEPADRREAIDRLVKLAAVGPLAAMLFDPSCSIPNAPRHMSEQAVPMRGPQRPR